MGNPSRSTRRAARAVRAFAAGHGGTTAVLEHVGRGRVRMVLVGADGEWGDVVVGSAEQARSAAELAGLHGRAVAESFDRELSARLRTGPRAWRRMAGMQIGGGA